MDHAASACATAAGSDENLNRNSLARLTLNCALCSRSVSHCDIVFSVSSRRGGSPKTVFRASSSSRATTSLVMASALQLAWREWQLRHRAEGCAEIHVELALPRPTQLARFTERLFEHLAMNLVYLVMLHVNAPSRSVPGLATDHRLRCGRNRWFADSPLEGGVWCELVSEFLESIKRGPNH